MGRVFCTTLLLWCFAFPAGAGAALVYAHPRQGKADEIFVARDDGASPSLIAHGHDPVVAPNGRTVAFFGDRGGKASTNLRAVSIHGGASRLIARQVYDGLSNTLAFSWSPNSRYIAVLSNIYGTTVVDVKRRRQRRLTFDCPSTDATFSPRSTRLAIGSSCERDSAVAVADVDGTHKRTITSNGMFPVWGSQGLAYAEQFGDVNEGDANTVITYIRRPGARRHKLLKHQHPEVFPVDWSRSGSVLLTYREVDNPGGAPFEPMLVSIPAARTRTLPTRMSEVDMLSPAGDAILGQANGNVVSVRSSDGLASVLAADARSPSWSR